MQKKAAWFHCWVAALLAAMAALQFTSVRMESQTADEGRQLVSGYTYLLSGRFTVAIEHPPLLKLLWAIPVWFLHPDPPHAGDAWHAAVDSLRRNHTPAGQLLLAGRSWETASLCSPSSSTPPIRVSSPMAGTSGTTWAPRGRGSVRCVRARHLCAAEDARRAAFGGIRAHRHSDCCSFARSDD